jgi:methyltransferase-like protein 6
MNSEFFDHVDDYICGALQGYRFSKRGPARNTGTSGVLSDPDLLWVEDAGAWEPERVLEAKKRVEGQGRCAPLFWREKYEEESGRYWHQFYKRNEDRFFKDRHYLHVVFPELAPSSMPSPKTLLEVGCGVGNALLPLVELDPALVVHAIDIAPSAIAILKEHKLYDTTGRIKAHTCDIVHDEIPVPLISMDNVLCMFVLSAISPKYHSEAIRKLAATIKCGGHLLLRDYGRYDEAQLRFSKGSKLFENFYVRQDGTCSYFFDKDELADLCKAHGLAVLENEYICRQYANRQHKKARYRVWVHARFIKTS